MMIVEIRNIGEDNFGSSYVYSVTINDKLMHRNVITGHSRAFGFENLLSMVANDCEKNRVTQVRENASDIIARQDSEDEIQAMFLLHIKRFWHPERVKRFCSHLTGENDYYESALKSIGVYRDNEEDSGEQDWMYETDGGPQRVETLEEALQAVLRLGESKGES